MDALRATYDLPEDAVDNSDYSPIINACRDIATVPGMTCEVGVRFGGSSMIIMQEGKVQGCPRYHVGIDPYGNIPYRIATIQGKTLMANDTKIYTEEMKLIMLCNIYRWCLKHNGNFNFFNMTDQEFEKRFPDGIPLYNKGEFTCNTYALVYLDGPHDTDAKLAEIRFFAPLIPMGGYIIIDNYKRYDDKAVTADLAERGFIEQERTHDPNFEDGMVSYKRVAP